MTGLVQYFVAVNVSYLGGIFQEMVSSRRWSCTGNDCRNIIGTFRQTPGPGAHSRLRVGAQHIRRNELTQLYSAKCEQKDNGCEQQNSSAVNREEPKGPKFHSGSDTRLEAA